MKRKISIAAIVAVAALGAAGLATARDWRDHGGHDGAQFGRMGGPGDGHHDGRMGGSGGPGGGHGMARLDDMMEIYDQNEDGALTQDEIDAVRAARMSEFDADGDGNLNLEEYQALWLDAMHPRMVDQFQRHDDDGDGLITAEEFGEHQARMVRRMDRNEDGRIDREDFQRQRPAPRGKAPEAPAE